MSLLGKVLTILTIAFSVASCQEQTITNYQQQSQPVRVSSTRWSRRPQSFPTLPTPPATAASTPACDSKELLNNLHDRISLLVTLDEDQRERLESISKKIVQFETSNLARLDSLNVRQTDFLKRLDSLDLLQHLTKRDIQDLRTSLEAKATRISHDNHNPNNNNNNNKTPTINDLSTHRSVRDAPQQPGENLSDSDKLEALSTLLVSTRAALNTLQVRLEGDLTRLMQETNKLNRRFANLQRRQQQQVQHSQGQPGLIGYLPASPQTFHRPLVTSCAQGAPTSHGILRIQLSEQTEPFYVRCDEDYMNGGWTIIQNRYTGDLNFQRDWSEYRTGFGNLASEFFIGLDKLHALTSNSVQELIIVLEDYQGNQRYAKYNLFAIGGEAESFPLKLLGEYDGDAGDSFTYHAGSKFSTFDNDNDGCVDCNCAQAHQGAWWYNWCEMSNLNGKYFKENETVPRYTGMYWHSFHGPNASLRAARMMIRPVVLDSENRR